MRFIQPKFLPVTKEKIVQYNIEIMRFVDKAAGEIFKTASMMSDAFAQRDLLVLNEKVLHRTISDDEILELNNILRRYGYMNWLFGRKTG
ncbi:hypothetical protein [Cohnella soli]|uniref:Uncharacterized protein n=1 Tax=Cohnella soli TaxID=425005 RepID=A0ABW0HQY2_9BACL